jgi:Domain of unknown function (DUF4440)
MPSLLLMFVAALALVVAPVTARASGTEPGESTESAEHAVNDVRAAEQARADATRRGDERAFGKLLDPSFVRINRFGRVLGPDDAAALAHTPGFELEDYTVRYFGDAAITTGRERLDTASNPLRFTRVWVHEGGQWLNLAEQITSISAEAVKPDVPSPDEIAVGGGVPPGGGAAAAELSQEESRYRNAERIDDLTLLAKYRMPDFVRVNRLGEIEPNEPTLLAEVKATSEEHDRIVRTRGNLGVVVGRLTWIDHHDASTGELRFMTVWIWRDGRWQVAAEQRTLLPTGLEETS